MPKLSKSLPKYRFHRVSRQAVVTLNGKDHYLGPHGTKASKIEYDRLIAEWLANGRRTPTPAPEESGITITELLAAYMVWAKGYYRDSDELTNTILSVAPLKILYGREPAAEFSPLKLKAVRQQMIEGKHLPLKDGEKPFPLCRNEINKRTGRIKRLFKWGVENEHVPPSVFLGLQAVAGLRRGRSEARESKPVKPVPDAFVDAIEKHVAPQVWTMVQLQRMTGKRPGEVTTMRTCDIDASGKVWVYTPANHKTQHHGHQRQIYIGPKAQVILRPWLRTELQAYLFQPREAVAWSREQRRLARKTPLSCGNRAGTNCKTNPQRVPAEFYDVNEYRNAIRRACDKADVPQWHPHQLRHNAATWLRKEYGLDVARCVLGHRSAAVTEVYAEADFGKAREVMGVVG